MERSALAAPIKDVGAFLLTSPLVCRCPNLQTFSSPGASAFIENCFSRPILITHISIIDEGTDFDINVQLYLMTIS